MALRQEGLSLWGFRLTFADGSGFEIVPGQIYQSAGGGYYSVSCSGSGGWSLLPISMNNFAKNTLLPPIIPSVLLGYLVHRYMWAHFTTLGESPTHLQYNMQGRGQYTIGLIHHVIARCFLSTAFVLARSTTEPSPLQANFPSQSPTPLSSLI